MERRSHILIIISSSALIVYLLLTACNLYLGSLNQDEGWYLYAARQIAEGQLPYQDFAYTQAPVMPFVYSFVYPIVDRLGVAGGRLITALFGFISILGAAWLSARISTPRWRWIAATTTFILVAVNVYQSYYTTVVKTYSLCSVLLIAGFIALSFTAHRRGFLASFLAGFLLTAAAGTRISAGVVLPIVFIYLVLMHRKFGAKGWLGFGIGGAIASLIIFLPFYVLAPEGFLFGMFEYHSGRSAGGFFPAMVYKAGFISRIVQAYYLSVVLLIGLFFIRWFKRSVYVESLNAATGTMDRFRGLIWCSVAAISLVHFSAPFPYDDYQAFVFPLFCAVLSAAWIGIIRIVSRGKNTEKSKAPDYAWGLWVVTVVCVASIAGAISSPINQEWMIQGRDRIWWKIKEQPDLVELRNVASWMKEYMQSGDELLTQDTYLAVETGLSVPEGLEMGAFSYYPSFSTEKARTLHVLNRELMEELLMTSTAHMAAFSGYGLSIESPGVTEIQETEQTIFWSLLLERYDMIYEVPNFGQASTLLRILRLKPEEDGADQP